MKQLLFYAGLVLWIVAGCIALNVVVDIHRVIHSVRVASEAPCGKRPA